MRKSKFEEMGGRLNAYLVEINKQAQERFEREFHLRISRFRNLDF